MASEASKSIKTDNAIYSTSNGVPYLHHPYGAQLSNPGGPLLLQDFNLIDSISHFDAERIPERVVHAKGGGGHGVFKLTKSLEDLTFCPMLTKEGYECPLSMRFSTVGGERGTPDTLRDPRGFAIKLKTDWGNMDWVFNNTPVFFLRDPNKFPHFIHTQKRDPSTNLNQNTDSTMTWDYFVQNIESIHQVTYMFGDRGTPSSWGKMHGYSGHTYKMLNADNKLTYVQIHILADGGFETFPEGSKAAELSGSAADYNTAKLYKEIEKGQYPTYTCYLQTMTPEQAENFRYSVNDLTKIWPHKEFPLREFGKITLNKNPDNYFAEIEQIAFSPSHLLPGLYPSNDPVLQSRLFSYPDTHRHRLGANYQQLPINKPRTFEKSSGCPFLAGNFQRDGFAAYDNQGFRPNYIASYNTINAAELKPNGELTFPKNEKYFGVVTHDNENKDLIIQRELKLKEHELKIWEKTSYYFTSGFSEIDLEQPRALYQKVYDEGQKKRFIDNVVGHASSITIPSLKQKVSQYFGLLDEQLGAQIAKNLGVPYKHLSLNEYAREIGISNTF
ncbi:hypothetical protein PACTADRAFT_48946 [Pachysolen tannophilus NRRL Y-2460]|uniref:Catalase T n=1 Tax=Pachysolen tannophilus NRRL Y-2460 TaxID=669874 RepID=A0A1E4TZM8_PACTA|nr:hypothetical protein PACTADRAFT_48946 [Pachysolen tannophilus NRRL Y-2460]